MNWEAIGSIAEILGALGVIASLLYLSVQVRQSTQATRLAMSHSVASAVRHWNQPLVADATETHRAPLMRAATSLRQSGGELLGVILTRISRSERSAVAVADAPDAPAE